VVLSVDVSPEMPPLAVTDPQSPEAFSTSD
jgi:hypothetical protein